MNSQAWDALYLYFSALENTYKKMLEMSAQDLLVSDDDTLDCMPLYQEIANNLKECKKNLTPLIPEKALMYLMSALIFHCDETVLTKKLTQSLCIRNDNGPNNRLQIVQSQWPTLQKQFLHCRNGGERFFFYLEELLEHSDKYSIVVEVYYFCLKQGFKGCYLHKQELLERIRQRCAQVIRTSASTAHSRVDEDPLFVRNHNQLEPLLGEHNEALA